MKATISNSSKILTMMALSSLLFINCTKETQPEPEPEPDPDPVSVVEGCDTFTEQDPSLNTAAIDFECTGNAFLEEDALSADNLDGNWGRFGGPDGQAYLKLNYIDNPNASGINTSTKVLSITENAGIEPWAGFFFNLNEKVNFPSGQEAIAIDVHSAAPGQDVLFKMEDSTNSDVFKESRVVTTAEGAWETLTYNFTAEDSGKYDRIVIIANIVKTNDAEAVYYMDNIRFTTPEETSDAAPIEAAPTPTVDAANVIAIYSDAYTPITVTELPTSWSGSGFEAVQIDGNNTIKYANLDFTGIVTDYENPTDLTSMDYVHFDYWTADATELGIKIVNTTVDPADEDLESVGAVTQGEWVSVDIPLNNFDVDRSAITQILIDNLVADNASVTVYIDNLYFYASDAPSEPSSAAPTPSVDEANVIAIYSDAYTPITVTELPTSWSGSGFEAVQIDGNNTIKYANLDFTGIVTDYGNPTDLSTMDYVHFDYWTADATGLGIKIVNTTVDPADEDLESVGTVTQGAWVSVDIALDDFDMDRSAVTQILFDNLVADDASVTVYIDNLYFYKQ
jgi:hypothetical protein